MMQRFGLMIQLKPGSEESYKRYHAAVWPQVLSMIHECNIRNYSIYLKDGILFSYFEYHGSDMKGGLGQDGGACKDAGMVGHHTADARAGANTKRRGVVGGDGRGIPSRLSLWVFLRWRRCEWALTHRIAGSF